jgi:Histidinol-phosphate/aromatic aminotransferase and cobyric acid decarboxylase
VQDRLGADVGEDRRGVVQRRLHEPGPGGDGVGVPGREVVEDGHLVTPLEEGRRDYAADVAGSTGDENAHAPTLSPRAVAHGRDAEARSGGSDVVSARPAVQQLPAYRPGRNPADLAREIGVERAVKLASNEVAFPPLPAVVEALAATAGETNRYPDNGAVVLTAALAERYGVDPDQVVTGCGAVMLCQQLAQSFNDPGTGIAFAWRSFEMYPLLARVAGARAVQVPLVPGRPAARPTPTTSRRWRPPSTTAPGWSSSATRTTPPGRRCAGGSWSGSSTPFPADTLVVLDEAYREFVTDPEVPDGLELMRGRPNVAVLRTFSKAGGWPGSGSATWWPRTRPSPTPCAGPTCRSASPPSPRPPRSPRWPARTRCADGVPRSPPSGSGSPPRCASAASTCPTARPTSCGSRSGRRPSGWRPRWSPGRSSPAPFAGEGIRVTVGTPEEDDVFLAALDQARSTATVA